MRPRSAQRLAVVFLAAALLVAGACRKKQEKPVPAAEATPVPAPRATAVPGSARVEVEMSDEGLSMPGSVLPGPTTFVIRNTGKKPHRLAIERGHEISRLEDAIDPGGEGQLQMTLLPGTYRAFCIFRAHKELPRQLVVTARRSY